MEKERLLLTSGLAAGDTLTMTAAVRDLFRARADKYLVNVETNQMEIWANNPYLDRGITRNNADRVIEMHYHTVLNTSNQDRSKHFINGYLEWLANALGIEIPLTEFKPDVHFTAAERSKIIHPSSKPYWVMFAGGKTDYTAKWWHKKKFERVVSALRGEVDMVQVGEAGKDKWNPSIPGAVHMIGKTTLRDLMILILQSHGVLCPVTCGLHFAAAMNKPCVILAGGREGFWWEQYDDQVYLHTIDGDMECCSHHGCWKSHVDIRYISPVNAETGKPVSDHERRDKVCPHVVNTEGQKQPKCMDAISSAMVVDEIRKYQREQQYVAGPGFTDFVPYKSTPGMVDKMTGNGRVAVCVCLYGDDEGTMSPQICGKRGEIYEDAPSMTFEMLQKRCIRSILENTDLSKINLYVGCNSVNEMTLQWLEKHARSALSDAGATLTIIDEPANIHKYPIMRKLFDSLQNERWVIWFDDDSYATSDLWLRRVAGATVKYSDHKVFGKLYNIRSVRGQWDWVQKAAWYKGIEPKQTQRRMGRSYPTYTFATGGFQVIARDVITQLDWPDVRIDHNGGDVMFGEACRQNGIEVKNIFKDGDIGIVISGAKRRGFFEAPAGATQRAVVGRV